MNETVDAAKVTGTTSTPWATPSLRKINDEVHDNSTQMRILGNLIIALGDLMERLMVKIEEQNVEIRDSKAAIKELTAALKETLG